MLLKVVKVFYVHVVVHIVSLGVARLHQTLQTAPVPLCSLLSVILFLLSVSDDIV